MRSAWFSLAVAGLANAAGGGVTCPFAQGSNDQGNNPHKRSTDMMVDAITPPLEMPVYTNDTDSYMTTDWGTPIQDQQSLKVGPRGPTLLEDFMFRQKLQRFDHERVSSFVSKCHHEGLAGTDKTVIRCPSVLFTPEESEPTEPSPLTEIGPTSLPPLSLVPRESRLIPLSASPQLQVLEEVQTLSVICTGLPPGSTLMKETTVSHRIRSPQASWTNSSSRRCRSHCACVLHSGCQSIS